MSEELGSWREGEYVSDWVGDDVLADLLAFPRKISVALVEASGVRVQHVVDLGSGHGPYLELLLLAFPQAHGTWVDSSPAMEPLGREKLARFGDRVSYVLGDVDQLPSLGLHPAEVVVSSRTIHHFSPDSIRRVYRAAYELLTTEGWFFNLDHFGAPSDWKQRYRAIRDRFTGPRKERLRPHREPFELTVPETQIQWLNEIGFDADMPWRSFFTALLAARKAEPADSSNAVAGRQSGEIRRQPSSRKQTVTSVGAGIDTEELQRARISREPTEIT